MHKAVAHGPALLQDVDSVYFDKEAWPALNRSGAQMHVQWVGEVGAILQPMTGDVRLSLHLALYQTPGVAYMYDTYIYLLLINLIKFITFSFASFTALQTPLAIQMRLVEINSF